jgi:hypothetical protein
MGSPGIFILAYFSRKQLFRIGNNQPKSMPALGHFMVDGRALRAIPFSASVRHESL